MHSTMRVINPATEGIRVSSRENIDGIVDRARIGLRELRAGTVWINDPLTDNDAAPFGAQRGIGRELGREGLEAFQESKHVHLDPKVEKKVWWYPYGPGDGSGQWVM